MRRIRMIGLMAGLALATACYTLVPVRGSAPVPGARIALDITDAGRVALGGAMGPAIDRVEGRLIDQANGEYRLGVTSVALLRGGSQPWSGEQVVFKPEFVGTVYERRLDPVRTGFAAALGVGAIAFIATRDLLASGTEDPDEILPDSSATRRSPTIRIKLLSVPTSRFQMLGR